LVFREKREGFDRFQVSHITAAKKELITRINRIQGQLDAIKDAIHKDLDCASDPFRSKPPRVAAQSTV
jgi:Metal-sensitive transcriptional repressor